MPKQKKVTLKQLKEFADITTQELNTYFSINTTAWSVFTVNIAYLEIEKRARDLGATAEQLTNVITFITNRDVVNGMGFHLTGRASNFTTFSRELLLTIPEVKEHVDNARYVELTTDDILILVQARNVVRKLHPEANLGWATPGVYSRHYKDTMSLAAGLSDKPGWNITNQFQEDKVLLASASEISLALSDSLLPAQGIFRTRYRKHGGKMRFSIVENLIGELKGTDTTPEDAQALFNQLVTTVEDSINSFVRIVMDPPRPQALTVELKELRYQEVEGNDDSTPDYLEVE